MALVSVTEQDKITKLAQAIYGREQEVHHYQINIDNYTAMLAALPQDDHPEDIAQFRGAQTEHLPHDLDDELVQKIADYQFRDRMRVLIRTERVEQNKAQRVLDALEAQLKGLVTDDEYTALVIAHKPA